MTIKEFVNNPAVKPEKKRHLLVYTFESEYILRSYQGSESNVLDHRTTEYISEFGAVRIYHVLSDGPTNQYFAIANDGTMRVGL